MRIMGDERLLTRTGDFTTLGVTAYGRWTNFAVVVPGAEEVILHVYDEVENEPLYSVVMGETEREGDIYAVQVQESPEARYYRYEADGVHFVDPCAKLITGTGVYGQCPTEEELRGRKGVIRTESFAWRGDKAPGISPEDMVLYELHIRGFSMLAGGSGQGTYLGVAGKAAYLRDLGVNAVLLMPCMEFEECERGICNYWGYASRYYFFAPKRTYASDSSRADIEFKTMVRKLHSYGIEVLMDVHVPARSNRTLVMEALRYWVREYHVDGFRVNHDQLDAGHVADDPYLSKVKFLGVHWNTDDIYSREYVPKVPRLLECNDGYAMDVRGFLKGDEGMAGAFAERVICGLDKCAVVNYITEHNGFTLADLYSYDRKHNEENGEGGKDGRVHNRSWNCGAEGPDRRKRVRELRMKMRKNAMATLLLSRGIPMLLAGDEFGNSQGGNNNAYCQDNAISWLDWKDIRRDAEFLNFVKEVLALRREHPVLRGIGPTKGTDVLSCGLPDVSVHSKEAWQPDTGLYNRSVGILLCGDYAKRENGSADNSFYVMYHMHWEEQEFAVPMLPEGQVWKQVLCTDKEWCANVSEERTISIAPRSVVVLMSVEEHA